MRILESEPDDAEVGGSAIIELQRALNAYREWLKKPQKIQSRNRVEFHEARDEFDQAVRYAIRRGLDEHPVVKDWRVNRCIFGEMTNYRHKKWPEKNKPMASSIEFWLRSEGRRWIEEGLKPHQVRLQLRRMLRMNQIPAFYGLTAKDRISLGKWLADITRQGFHKALRDLGVLEPRD